jgi:hypothetical protein
LRDYKPKNLGDQACTHKLRMWLPYMFDAPHLHVCRTFMCMYKTFVAPVFLMQTYLHRTWWCWCLVAKTLKSPPFSLGTSCLSTPTHRLPVWLHSLP